MERFAKLMFGAFMVACCFIFFALAAVGALVITFDKIGAIKCHAIPPTGLPTD